MRQPALRTSLWPKLYGYLRKLLMPLGFDFYLKMDDRRVLESIILPYFRDRDEFRFVLFVGCDWYTRGYRNFFQGRTYWTMDFDPHQKQFGGSRHLTDAIQNIGIHFKPGEIDLIICNGVYGYGLDDLKEFDRALLGCFNALRDDGVFILGWDDNPNRRPFPLDSSRSLTMFSRFHFAPLETDRYVTANAGRHTFDFYIKRKRSGSS